MNQPTQPARIGKRASVLDPRRAGKWWLLALALLLVLGAGLAYGQRWQAGLRGAELLEFTAKYLCAPFAVGLLVLFAYFKPSARRAG
jgi:hypothetical protein